MRTAALFAVALHLAACAGARNAPSRETGSAPVPDRAMGLSRSSVFEDPAPPEVKPRDSEPGEEALLPRPYPGAPPAVPHEIDERSPVTAKENACLDCHAVKGPKEEGLPTPVPPSHYTDLRREPGAPGPQVVGARYFCTACHVSPSHAEPLVGNRFAP
jgi:nitrate reductase (cytochrome), electron transfer subunit